MNEVFSMGKRRVVITGIGMVTPLGLNTDTVWDKLISGKSGVKIIDRFDTSGISSKIAGQVLNKSSCEDGFDPEDWVSSNDIKKMDDFILYGMAAAISSVNDSGIMESKVDCDRVGVLVGSGIGGLVGIEKACEHIMEKGAKHFSPFFLPKILTNLLAGNISIKYGFTGPNEAVVSACASGSHAISDSARLIQTGAADVMIAGGAEGCLCKLGVISFAAARALSTSYNDTPELASRPWDRDRDGFVIAEGAGILVLEEYNHAKKRNAKIYAELVGYGLAADAYHTTSPHPDGRGAIKTMDIALKNSGLDKEDIGYINAHSTSTKLGDEIELKAIKEVFGETVEKIPISSTKSSIGHLLGAAGSVEAIFSILALNSGIVPPTLNLYNPPEDCNLNLVPLVAQEHPKMKAVLSNSFGFGGANVSLIFSRI